jgi:hypothetical protein
MDGPLRGGFDSFSRADDPDFARVADAWPGLPEHVQTTTVTLIDAAGGSGR